MKVLKWKMFVIMICIAALVAVGCGQGTGSSGSSDSVNASSSGSSGNSGGSSESSGSGTTSASESTKVDYPTKEVKVIVPWAAGGGTDLVTRITVAEMEKTLGQPFVVENVEGGGGLVGFETIKNAKPDGYTIGAISNSLLLQKYTQDQYVDYSEYEPIAIISDVSAALTVNANSPWQNLTEFIEAAKQDPGKIRISNSGPGAIWHVAAMAFEKAAGVKFTHVPFQGGKPAATAAAGGHVEATTVNVEEVIPLVESGELRVLGVMADERLPYYPDIPTFKEQGIDLSMNSWRAIAAPKGTPPEIMEILVDAAAQAVETEEFKKQFEANTFAITFIPGEEFRAFMENQDKQYEELFKEMEASGN